MSTWSRPWTRSRPIAPRSPSGPSCRDARFMKTCTSSAWSGRPPSWSIPAAATVYMDTRKTEGIERFYEDVYGDNVDAFAISEQAAPGFYALLERLPRMAEGIRYVKGQLTGPFTLGIGLKDENGKPVIYDGAYFDIIKKALRMKAAWMIKAIKRVCPDKEVLLFFDEPALVSFGSAFVSVSARAVTSLFDEVREGLDARVGVHCCGNTDWSVLLRTGVDIINYDAFNFMETLFYFRRELSAFLARGGRIAPGIVPSSGEALHEASLADLARLWHAYAGRLA